MDNSSLFRTTAIASGLLTDQQIREAEAALRADAASVGTHTEGDDEALIAKLVELKHLNQWQSEQLKVGRTKFTLGPYRIVDSIGQGGMGQVFKAEHTMMGRVVAIKVLPLSKSTPGSIASFTREIRAQAQLDHENLVRAFDAGHDGNVHFLVTEYVPGTDLRKLVRIRGRLSMQEAATIISQAAKGLMHAHGRGLIHRDVKPGNLLVTTNGQTKVLDLGLAGFLEAEADDPRAGKIVGTADYLSPEHIMHPAKISASSDIYSLGCTLYYAVTGKVPYPGGSVRDKARRHCQDTPINPRRFNPDLSDEFIEVVAAMMNKDPAYRMQTAAEVIERLSPWAMDAISLAPEEGGATLSESGGSNVPLIPGSGGLPSSWLDNFGELADERLTQTTHGTDSMAAATAETMPDYDGPLLEPEPLDVPLGLVLLVLLPLLTAGGVLLATIIVKSLL